MADANSKCCTRCGEIKPIAEFALCRGKPRARCKPCHTKDAQRWADNNRAKYLKRLRDWWRDHLPAHLYGPPLPPEMKHERAKEKRRAYAAKNREYFKAHNAKWLAKNKHVAMEVVRRRQCAKKSATPAWADRKEMQAFYAESKRLEVVTGRPHDVDHIVPIQSKRVCGLHCPANLQVLPRTENRKKHNSYWPDMWD